MDWGWWSSGYWLGLSAALIAALVFACLMFIPLWLEISESGIRTKMAFRPIRSIRFDEVKAYGFAFMVFLVEPKQGSTLQFFAAAFPRNDRNALFRMFESKCPGKKAWL